MRSPRSLWLTDIERGSANSAYVRRAHNAARVVVHDEQRGGARCQARGHEHVRQRDGRARARAAGEHVPGEELVASGEARDGEDLHCLAGQERRQRGSGDSRIAEGLRR